MVCVQNRSNVVSISKLSLFGLGAWRCAAIRYNVVPYGTVRCGAVWYSVYFSYSVRTLKLVRLWAVGRRCGLLKLIICVLHKTTRETSIK